MKSAKSKALGKKKATLSGKGTARGIMQGLNAMTNSLSSEVRNRKVTSPRGPLSVIGKDFFIKH